MATNNSLNTYIVPTANNEVTRPSQPAFLSYLSAQDNAVTGAGTVFTVGSSNALSKIFDQNTDLNVNGTFTAPVTGVYQFHASVRGGASVASTNGYVSIVTSNRTYIHLSQNVIGVKSTGGGWNGNVSPLTDMDAADTATYTITVTGEAGDIINIIGGGGGNGSNTLFMGVLMY